MKGAEATVIDALSKKLSKFEKDGADEEDLGNRVYVGDMRLRHGSQPNMGIITERAGEDGKGLNTTNFKNIDGSIQGGSQPSLEIVHPDPKLKRPNSHRAFTNFEMSRDDYQKRIQQEAA